MKIKSNFILKEMDDMNIVVAVGDRAKSFNGVITLNSTATFMWKKLEEGISREDLALALTEEYSVDLDKAKEDVEKFIDTLLKEDIIDE